MNIHFCKYWLTFFLLNSFFLSGQQPWKLEKEKDGIIVYTRATSFSTFNEFKAHTVIDQSIHSFLAVMNDVESLPSWAYNVKKAKSLKKSSDSLMIYYTEVAVPFPFSDRDGIYQNSFTWKSDSSILIVDVKVLPDYIEKNEDFIRIPFGRGLWRIEAIGEKKLVVTFQMLVDPGGDLPAWLANLFVTDTPIYTLTKLKEIITQPRYQNQQFNMIK